MLNLVNAGYGLGVSGVAAYSPYGIGRVENDSALSHAFYSFLYIFTLFHILANKVTANKWNYKENRVLFFHIVNGAPAISR